MERKYVDTRLEVLALLGALNWIPESYSPKGADGPDEIGDKMADTLLYGLLLKGSPK